MQHYIQRTGALLKFSAIGAIVGVAAAVGGLAVEGWNVDHYGASYRSYQFDEVTLGALPGMLIAERRFGSDFQLGEVLHHRSIVVGWNALVYASVSASAFLLFGGRGRRDSARFRTETELPNKTRQSNTYQPPCFDDLP